MPQRCTVCISTIALLILCFSRVFAQTVPSSDRRSQGYTLTLPVDEVVLTFHATDAEGKPVNDIKSSEIQLWDNGLPPHRIVSFGALLDRPLRIGILMDTSESMGGTIESSRAIAGKFLQGLFRQNSDEAFVEVFGVASETAQTWSNDPSLIQQSIRSVRLGKMNPVGGTAIYNALFHACFYEFGKADPTATGNIILLFSDGEDNAGLTTLQEAMRACQRSNTTIYAFHVPPHSGDYSPGPKNLRDLTRSTGGRLFSADDSEAELKDDLRTIDSESRNQYRLVYDPGNFKHDGSFRAIEIQPPDRVKRIEVRTGYYAPLR